MKVARMYTTAVLPTREHPTDAGIDLYVDCMREDLKVVIPPHSFGIVHTGITVEIEEGYVGLVWPKGSSNYLIGGGVVDSAYQGEILVKVFNILPNNLIFKHGDPVAQLLIQPVVVTPVEEVSYKEIHKVKSERGDTGGIVEQTKKPTYVQG